MKKKSEKQIINKILSDTSIFNYKGYGKKLKQEINKKILEKIAG